MAKTVSPKDLATAVEEDQDMTPDVTTPSPAVVLASEPQAATAI